MLGAEAYPLCSPKNWIKVLLPGAGTGALGQSLQDQIDAARNGGSGGSTLGDPSALVAAGPDAAAAAPTVDTAAAPDDITTAAGPVFAQPAPTTTLGANVAANGMYNAPVAKYLSNTNASFFSITWLALEAANLAGAPEHVSQASGPRPDPGREACSGQWRHRSGIQALENYPSDSWHAPHNAGTQYHTQLSVHLPACTAPHALTACTHPHFP